MTELCSWLVSHFLQNLNFHPSNMYFNWLCMLSYTLAHYCVGYIALTIRVLRQR